MDDTWVPAIDEASLADETVCLAFPKGIGIILIKKAGRVYALRNRCAHMSCTLGAGRLNGDTLQCPCHDWAFDITTGELIAAREIRIPVYPCRSENGTIHVKLEDR